MFRHFTHNYGAPQQRTQLILNQTELNRT